MDDDCRQGRNGGGVEDAGQEPAAGEPESQGKDGGRIEVPGDAHEVTLPKLHRCNSPEDADRIVRDVLASALRRSRPRPPYPSLPGVRKEGTCGQTSILIPRSSPPGECLYLPPAGTGGRYHIRIRKASATRRESTAMRGFTATTSSKRRHPRRKIFRADRRSLRRIPRSWDQTTPFMKVAKRTFE
jgi:hypothetical protein